MSLVAIFDYAIAEDTHFATERNILCVTPCHVQFARFLHDYLWRDVLFRWNILGMEWAQRPNVSVFESHGVLVTVLLICFVEVVEKLLIHCHSIATLSLLNLRSLDFQINL